MASTTSSAHVYFLFLSLVIFTARAQYATTEATNYLAAPPVAKPPTPAPVKPHTPPSVIYHAPTPAPVKPHTPPPVSKPSTPPPVKPYTPSPKATSPPPHLPTYAPPTKIKQDCVQLCEVRCKESRKKRPCMKACTECCKDCNNCVPPGSYGTNRLACGQCYANMKTDDKGLFIHCP